MLPRKRAREGGVVVEVDTDTTTTNTNSGAASFPKKARIGSFVACSSAGAADSPVNVSGQGFSSGGGDNSVENSVGGMTLGNSHPAEIDEDLHSRQLAVYGRETMRRLFASSVLFGDAGSWC